MFSGEGSLTQKLLNPKTGIEREYEAIVEGNVNEIELRDTLAMGVQTSEGFIQANLLFVENNVRFIPPEKMTGIEPCSNDLVKDNEIQGGSMNEKEVRDKFKSNACIRLTVTEGKYRMVRRVLNNAGHPVLALKRLRYGEINLGDVEEGDVRKCTEQELLWLEGLINR